MPRAPRGRRNAAAIAGSAIFHIGLLAILASQASRLHVYEQDAGPPIPIIPVLLVPKLPAPSATAPPAPLRLHRRPQKFTAPSPIPPLPAPAAQASRPAPPGPVAVHPAPLPEGPRGDLRATLRASEVGCANPDAVGLSKAEREHCNEQLGKGARTAAFAGLGLAREKQDAFDQAARLKDQCRTYRSTIGGEMPRLRDGVC